MPTKEEYEARAAAALQRVEAAKKQQEEELAALMQEVAAKERRMAERALNKQALKTKRQADAWDPTPTPRPMADDHRLKMSARDPGPGAHSPRSECFFTHRGHGIRFYYRTKARPLHLLHRSQGSLRHFTHEISVSHSKVS